MCTCVYDMYIYIYMHVWLHILFINITLTTEGFKTLLELVPSSQQTPLAQPSPSPAPLQFREEIPSKAHFNNQFKTNIGPLRIINYNKGFSKGYSAFKNIHGFLAPGMFWLTFLMHHISLINVTSLVLCLKGRKRWQSSQSLCWTWKTKIKTLYLTSWPFENF